ncbi:hypothetical protein D3C87_1524590 [compost metagenome]
MWRDDHTVELFARNVGEREHGPVALVVLGAGAHFDAPDNAVGTWRRRNLEGFAAAAVDLGRGRQIECGVFARNLDRLESMGNAAKGAEQRCESDQKRCQLRG